MTPEATTTPGGGVTKNTWTLIVEGIGDATLDLTDGVLWQEAGTQEEDGTLYDVYTADLGFNCFVLLTNGVDVDLL